MSPARISVKNPVAVNLLMWSIIIGGAYSWHTLLREFFPPLEPEQVAISVRYPGATPEEIEKSVTRRIEREIQDVDGIKEIESSIFEALTLVMVTLEEGADRDRVLNDLRTEIDKVKPELPAETEEPAISEVRPNIPVIAVAVYGDVSEERLREVARDVHDDLMDMPEISEVFLSGVRDRELWVEVQPEKLEEHGLTFEDVGRVVGASNIDVPGGQVKSSLGNIRVRTLGEKNRAAQLEGIVIKSRPDGTAVRLREIASIRETFEDKVEKGHFAGKLAASITVFKSPEEDALKIARKVKQYVADRPTRLGGAIHLKTQTDLSRFIAQRLELMIRNARTGLFFVIIALAFFLDFRVAFWVAAGLPTAFLGTFIFMSFIGESINLISLFGLIVVLGLLVDDAIVVGENVFTRQRKGVSPIDAAIEGTNEVALPVVAAILTTVVAFLPLAFIEGRLGTFLGVLPKVVICALSMSMLEAFLILPAHLAHRRKSPSKGILGAPGRGLAIIESKKNYLIEKVFPDVFEWFLKLALRWRYATIAAAIGFSIAVVGLVVSEIVPYVFIQQVDAESLSVNLEMAVGTPEERTSKVISKLEKMTLGLPEVDSVFSVVGVSFSERGREEPDDPETIGQLNVELKPADEREARGMRTSRDVITELRRRSRDIPGVRKLSFLSHSGGPEGADIEIRLRGDDLGTVARALNHVRRELGNYSGIAQVEDDLKLGKREFRVRLLDSGRALGLTTQSLALQLRHALYGFEAQKLQEEEDEVTVRVLLPQLAKRKLSDLGRLRIATPSGHRVPLGEVATFESTRGYASLYRVDGKRAVTIKAEVNEDEANVSQITRDLTHRLENISTLFPGVALTFEGRKKETRESVGSLMIGFPVALLLIYVIIAVLFRSYTQPIIVMAAIPYSIVGAICGHYIMGFPFTILSMVGVVALAGIVVNDSLILVDLINRLRREGTPLHEAVIVGARGRLRAILLTSITTILGLAPLMLERSFQAQFLIPMAISLVFGLGFATLLTLVLIPASYLVFEDVWASLRWLFTGQWSRALAYDPKYAPVPHSEPAP